MSYRILVRGFDMIVALLQIARFDLCPWLVCVWDCYS